MLFEEFYFSNWRLSCSWCAWACLAPRRQHDALYPEVNFEFFSFHLPIVNNCTVKQEVQFKIWIVLLSFANFQAALLKKVKLRICKSFSFSCQMPSSGTTADHRGSIWIRTVASILSAGSFGHLSNVYSVFYLAYRKQTLPEAHVQCSAHFAQPTQSVTWIIFVTELNFYSSHLQR